MQVQRSCPPEAGPIAWACQTSRMRLRPTLRTLMSALAGIAAALAGWDKAPTDFQSAMLAVLALVLCWTIFENGADATPSKKFALRGVAGAGKSILAAS